MEVPMVQIQWFTAFVSIGILLIDIDVCRIKLIDTEQQDFQSSLSSTEYNFVLSVIFGRTNKLHYTEAILLHKSLSCNFFVSIKPHVLHQLSNHLRFFFIGRHYVVTIVRQFVNVAIVELDVIRICKVLRQPLVKICLHSFFILENTIGVYLVSGTSTGCRKYPCEH